MSDWYMTPGVRMALAGAGPGPPQEVPRGVRIARPSRLSCWTATRIWRLEATVKDWLVLGTESFARQRLEALVQAEDHIAEEGTWACCFCVSTMPDDRKWPSVGSLTSPATVPLLGLVARNPNVEMNPKVP